MSLNFNTTHQHVSMTKCDNSSRTCLNWMRARDLRAMMENKNDFFFTVLELTILYLCSTEESQVRNNMRVCKRCNFLSELTPINKVVNTVWLCATDTHKHFLSVLSDSLPFLPKQPWPPSAASASRPSFGHIPTRVRVDDSGQEKPIANGFRSAWCCWQRLWPGILFVVITNGTDST